MLPALASLIALQALDTAADSARKRLAEGPADVVLVDPGLPDGDGLELLRDDKVQADVVVITGSTSVEAAVDALTRQLRDAGYPVLDVPRRTGDGYYESVVLDPEGNRVEIMA